MTEKNPPKSKRCKRVLNLVDNIIDRVEERVATGSSIEAIGSAIPLQKVASILKSLNNIDEEEEMQQKQPKEMEDGDEAILERYIDRHVLDYELRRRAGAFNERDKAVLKECESMRWIGGNNDGND